MGAALGWIQRRLRQYADSIHFPLGKLPTDEANLKILPFGFHILAAATPLTRRALRRDTDPRLARAANASFCLVHA